MRTTCKLMVKVARPGRVELPTLCLEGRRSFQLSYGRSLPNFSHYKHLRYPCSICTTVIFGTFGTTGAKIELGKANPAPILSAICFRNFTFLLSIE
jgi:hypothetical protein